MTRPIAGVGSVLLLAATPLVEPVFGRLGPALVLLLVLPPLAAALASLGWPDRAAARLGRIPSSRTRVLVAYAAWLGASALLGLDVAVLVAAFVAVAATKANTPERRMHLLAAILGANAGSMLFPFSNLTNLVVAGGAGIGFGEYVGAAWPAQLAVGVAGAAVLWIAARGLPDDVAVDPVPTGGSTPLALLGGVVALGAGVAAIVVGFRGGDVAIPFAIAAAAVAAIALAGRTTTAGELRRSLPVAGIGLVVAAAAVGALAPTVATGLPHLPGGPAGIVVAAVAGGVLAAAINNLPAALIGALWLGPVAPPVAVAFLVGTNVLAVATPHGSVATMLARTVAARDAERMSAARYLGRGWRYAVPPALAAVVVIVVLAR